MVRNNAFSIVGPATPNILNPELFGPLVESSGFGMIVGGGDGTITYANPTAAQLLGYGAEHLMTLRWTELTPPEYAERDAAAIAEILTRGSCTPYEKEFISASGDRVPVLLNAVLVASPPGRAPLLAACLMDLSSLRQTQQRLLRRERLLEAMAFSADRLLRAADWRRELPAVLGRWGEALEVDRVYMFENHRDEWGRTLTSQRCEWTREGVTAQINNPHLRDQDYLRSGFERWLELLARGLPVMGHVRHFPAAERAMLQSQEIASVVVLPIFAGSAWWGFLGFDSLTEREWSDADIDALRATANHLGTAIHRARAVDDLRRLSLAVQQTAEAIAIIDPDGRLRYANAAFATMTGYEPNNDLLPAERIEQLIPDTDLLQEAWLSVMRGETWSGRMSSQATMRTFTADATFTPIRGGDGRILQIVTVLRDVTDQVEVEAQLLQAQKMEAIGQLAGGVAHDFNNLLQVIQGYGQLALGAAPSGSSQAAHLEEVLKAADKAVALVRQLLTFSRRQLTQFEHLNINCLLPDVLRMLRRLLGEHIQIELKLDPELPTIFADPGQIEQIIINLCVNARDAMPGGGTITIETANVQLSRTFSERHPGLRPGRYARLTVRDTGVGIELHHQPHIFEPFFTTKEVGKGTGLGLATVYGIIKRHEGLIEVASRPSQGATFTIHLPMDESLIAGMVDSIPDEHIGNGETILLAEDDDLVRGLAVRILEGAGYCVLAARDGVEALELFEQSQSEIDLVLLDVVMPRLSGRVVYDRLLERGAAVPVLFTSGYSMHLLETSMLPQTQIHVIPKPFNPEELLPRIRQHLLRTHELT